MTSEPLATSEELESRLGSSVRELRTRKRLTQSDLASLANVSISSLKRLEAGAGSSTSTVIRVVRALGRTDWLAELVPPAPTVSPRAVWRATNATPTSPARVRRPGAASGAR